MHVFQEDGPNSLIMEHDQLITLLEELSLRSSHSEDENYQSKDSGVNFGSNYNSSSNVSSPNYDQLTGNIAEEDVELKSAVNSLFQDLKPSNQSNSTSVSSANQSEGYDKAKLLVTLLGNIDLVTCAVKKINQLVSLGKRMEQIYRSYYVNPNVNLDLNELGQLISAFSDIYNSEKYVREVNVSRVYHAFCQKLIEIHNLRSGNIPSRLHNQDDIPMS